MLRPDDRDGDAELAALTPSLPGGLKYEYAFLNVDQIAFSISQDTIIEGLHKEAQYTGHGSSHAARVAAPWQASGFVYAQGQAYGQERRPDGNNHPKYIARSSGSGISRTDVLSLLTVNRMENAERLITHE